MINSHGLLEQRAAGGDGNFGSTPGSEQKPLLFLIHRFLAKMSDNFRYNSIVDKMIENLCVLFFENFRAK